MLGNVDFLLDLRQTRREGVLISISDLCFEKITVALTARRDTEPGKSGNNQGKSHGDEPSEA